MGARTLCAWLIASTLLIGPTTAQALSGDLDLAFGGFGSGGRIQDLQQDARDAALDTQGRLVTVGTVGGTFRLQRRSGARFLDTEDAPISFAGQSASVAKAIAIAADGKIVVAGEVQLSGQEGGVYGVARLNPDLSADATFGEGDGAQISPHEGTNVVLGDVAVQSDQKIVIAGSVLLGSNPAIAVQRFNEDGSPDASFDSDGKLTLPGATDAVAVVIQNDGKIVVAAAVASGDDLVVIRLSSDGTLDTSFGGDGFVTVNFGEVDESAADIAITADGRIIVVGTGSTSTRILVARYSTDGEPDFIFGEGGQVVTMIPDGGKAEAIALQRDNKIVVGGQAGSGVSGGDFLLLRYNEDGSVDDTFGDPSTPGAVTPFDAATTVTALAVQADGMLVAVGGGQAARYRWNGSLDAGGIVTLAFHPQQTRGEVTGLAADGDGRVVAAGSVRVGDFNMALARFGADYSTGLDLTFGTDDPLSGRTMYGVPDQNEEVQALAVRADGKLVVTGQTSMRGPTSLMVGRFNSDGTPDLGCNSIGFVSSTFGFGNDAGRALALAPNERIYAAGRVLGPEDTEYGVIRFAPDCTVDTFGNPPAAYKVAFDIDQSDFLNGVVYQADVDRPVLAGISGGDVVLTRVFANAFGMAEPDSTFGSNGYAKLDVGANESIAGLATQSDGKLIVAGTVANDFFVTRFSADGDLDMTFGSDGIALSDVGGVDGAFALSVREDDSIAVAGSSFSEATSKTVMAVALFTPDGDEDQSFGMNGKATVAFGGDGGDVAQAVTFVGSDRLVLGGYATAAGARRFALAALETEGEETPPCTGDCDGDGMVFVNELLSMINIALGTANVSTCEAGDPSGDGFVTVDEILGAVNNALNGCPIL